MTENDLQRGKELKAELEEYKSIRSKIKFQKIDRNVAIDKAKKKGGYDWKALDELCELFGWLRVSNDHASFRINTGGNDHFIIIKVDEEFVELLCRWLDEKITKLEKEFADI